ERPVEFATVGDRVEMRAGPDVRLLAAADQVPGRIDLHLETRLAHPARGELVRVILVGAPTDTVRAGAAADRIELVQPLENPHGRIISDAQRPGSNPAGSDLRSSSIAG